MDRFLANDKDIQLNTSVFVIQPLKPFLNPKFLFAGKKHFVQESRNVASVSFVASRCFDAMRCRRRRRARRATNCCRRCCLSRSFDGIESTHGGRGGAVEILIIANNINIEDIFLEDEHTLIFGDSLRSLGY